MLRAPTSRPGDFMSHKFLAAAAAFAMLAACTPAADNTTSIATAPTVGVLEERPGANTEEAPRHVVRALFHKEGTGWESYDPNCGDEACLSSAPANAPQRVTWTISNRGQSLGEVTAATPTAWAFYADVGLQEIEEGSTAPTLGERSNDFAPDAATPLHRPLIATSPGAFADPEAWMEWPLTEEAEQAVRAAFRAQFASVANCASATTSPQPRTYADADIEINQAHASPAGWRIATARLLGYACDGPVEGAYAEQTFAISPTNEARLLGEGYRFLDAGDYDADGQSEVIFAINQYNTGGYALYANDFAQSAVFDFSYH
jgi:hypothetical protein